MKELALASPSPNYVFRYPGQTMMGELDYQYHKNFLNKNKNILVKKNLNLFKF